LGVALQNVSCLANGPPSESPSSSSDNLSIQGLDSDGDTERLKRKQTCHQTKKHGKHQTKAVSSKELIKPITPREYDGSVDAHAYHRFVEESTAYLIDSCISVDCHISTLSHYLTGRAYDFYTQKVSLNKKSWDLADFYSELFNYCFPINFQMQMCQKWDKSRQNEKNISEWAHELEELYNMIGDLTKQAKVLKLWMGARPSIQKELWCSDLNPEITSWGDVLAASGNLMIVKGIIILIIILTMLLEPIIRKEDSVRALLVFQLLYAP
jgi:hypothetical protein